MANTALLRRGSTRLGKRHSTRVKPRERQGCVEPQHSMAEARPAIPEPLNLARLARAFSLAIDSTRK